MAGNNLLTLEWTSSINQNVASNTGLSYAGLFTQHIKNLVDNLINTGSWVAVSSSYYHTGDNVYKAEAGNKWATVSNIKFPIDAVEAPLKNGQPDFEKINVDNGFYVQPKHPWMLLKHLKEGSTTEYIYMIIDCRYPLPPHKQNVSIIWDNTVGVDGGPKYSNYPTELLLGASRIAYDIVNAKNALPKEQNLNYFNGIAVPESDTYIIDNSVAAPQTFASRAVAFVDIIHSHVEPVNGSTNVRPVTNNITNLDSFDNNSVYTCWGFSSLSSGQGRQTAVGANITNYYYHFHADPNNGSFLYQLSVGTTEGGSNFDSICGLIKVANAHSGDIFPYTTITINKDPGFSERSLCFNNVNGRVIRSITGTPSQIDNLTPTDIKMSGSDVMNTFYNTCFRNYNFTSGTLDSSYVTKKFGSLKTEKTPDPQYPVFAPLKPSDASIFAKDTLFPLIVISGSTISGKERIEADSTNDVKIDFGTIDSDPTPSPAESTIITQYKISSSLNTTWLTTKYDLRTVYGDKLVASNAAHQHQGVVQGTIANAFTSKALPNNAYVARNTALNTLTNAGTAPFSKTAAEQATELKTGNFIANPDWVGNVTGAFFPEKVTVTTDISSPSSLKFSNFLNSNNVNNPSLIWVDSVTNEKYFKIYAGTTKGFYQGGASADIIPTTDANSSYNGCTVTIYTDESSEQSAILGKLLKQLESDGTDSPIRGAGLDTAVLTNTLAEQRFIYTAPTNSTQRGFYRLTFTKTTNNTPSKNQVYGGAKDAFKFFRGIPGITPAPAAKPLALDNIIEGLIAGKMNISATSTGALHTLVFGMSLNEAQIAELNKIKNFPGASGVKERPAADNIPVYMRVPVDNIYQTGKFLESSVNVTLAYDFVDTPAPKHWRTDTELSPPHEQTNGTNAFSVFKTLNKLRQTPLVAVSYSVNEDKEKIFTNGSVLGISKNTTDATENEKNVLLTDKNSSDSTYSELPIFLLSVDPKSPELKGYVNDIFWGPRDIPNGSLVRNPAAVDQSGNFITGQKLYSKIYWNGWWMPWLGNDGPNWG